MILSKIRNFLLAAIVSGGLLFWTSVLSAQDLGCPPSPNCVSSFIASIDKGDSEEEFVPEWYIEPIAYENVDGIAIGDRLSLALFAMGLEDVRVTGLEVTAVARSPLFGFKDDFSAVIVPEQKRINIRSASRTGYYDFGKNRERLERLRELLGL